MATRSLTVACCASGTAECVSAPGDQASARVGRHAELWGAREPLECALDDPRDMHLRAADPRADLPLPEVVLEAEPQHGAHTLVEPGDEAVEGVLRLDLRVAGLLAADGVADRDRVVVAVV